MCDARVASSHSKKRYIIIWCNGNVTAIPLLSIRVKVEEQIVTFCNQSTKNQPVVVFPKMLIEPIVQCCNIKKSEQQLSADC